MAIFKDSDGDDEFFANPLMARMNGNGFFNVARGFDVNNAFAHAGGDDNAILVDSNGDDRFVGRSNRGFLSNGTYRNFVSTFDEVEIRGINGGTNTLDVDSLLYILEEIGDWN